MKDTASSCATIFSAPTLTPLCLRKFLDGWRWCILWLLFVAGLSLVDPNLYSNDSFEAFSLRQPPRLLFKRMPISHSQFFAMTGFPHLVLLSTFRVSHGSLRGLDELTAFILNLSKRSNSSVGGNLLLLFLYLFITREMSVVTFDLTILCAQ